MKKRFEFRCTKEQLAKWKKAAEAEGLSLSQWLTREAEKAARKGQS